MVRRRKAKGLPAKALRRKAESEDADEKEDGMNDGCCGPSSGDSIRKTVRSAYGEIAKTSGSCCGPAPSCCGSPDPDALAGKVGYAGEDLSALPEGANLGLSCGNPTALASP